MNLETKPTDSPLDLPPYIDQPEYVTNKLAGYGLHIVGWFLWIWLFIPILTLALWFYQGTVIQQHLIDQKIENQLHHFKWIMFVILLMMLGLVVWAIYNWYRFYQTENRPQTDVVTVSEMETFFELTHGRLTELKQQKLSPCIMTNMANLLRLNKKR